MKTRPLKGIKPRVYLLKFFFYALLFIVVVLIQFSYQNYTIIRGEMEIAQAYDDKLRVRYERDIESYEAEKAENPQTTRVEPESPEYITMSIFMEQIPLIIITGVMLYAVYFILMHLFYFRYHKIYFEGSESRGVGYGYAGRYSVSGFGDDVDGIHTAIKFNIGVIPAFCSPRRYLIKGDVTIDIVGEVIPTWIFKLPHRELRPEIKGGHHFLSEFHQDRDPVNNEAMLKLLRTELQEQVAFVRSASKTNADLNITKYSRSDSDTYLQDAKDQQQSDYGES